MKHLSIMLLSGFFFLSQSQISFAQNELDILPGPENYSHVQTPNAASFGQYGKIPVSHFTGIPKIEIPIATFEAKGYELPVYLSYHAAGNKPDQHPGWVGLGWTLHAGGAITRTVRGWRDELVAEELYAPETAYAHNQETGYLYQMANVQSTNWNDDDSYTDVVLLDDFLDREPDEYHIDLPGLSASFYMTGPDQVKIVSQQPCSFEVNWGQVDQTAAASDVHMFFPRGNRSAPDLKTKVFRYIKAFTVKTGDGIIYQFGGDDSSIEFSTIVYPKYGLEDEGGPNINKNEWYAVSTPNTWLLNRIILPCRDTIRFSYEKDGVPIVRNYSDSYYGLGWIRPTLPSQPNNSIIGTIWWHVLYGLDSAHYNSYPCPISYNSRIHPEEFRDVSYSFLEPSYLRSIISTRDGTTMSFSRSRTTELSEDIPQQEFLYKVGRFYPSHLPPPDNSLVYLYDYPDFMERNYYMQLDSIQYNGITSSFEYTSSTTTRLKLLSLEFQSDTEHPYGYDFAYDITTLPGYNSRQTDHWGYYNGKPSYRTVSYQSIMNYRTPDSQKMIAEILTRIEYPTGGFTVFEYEPNSYSKIARQYPFELENTSGIGGGLRIKKITHGTDSQHRRTVEYRYVSGDGTSSSGILSGIPLYAFTNMTEMQSGADGEMFFYQNDFSNLYQYYYFSDSPINDRSTTNGCDVTYSRIEEIRSDGSKTVYRYSNHDTPGCMDQSPSPIGSATSFELPLIPFTSRELQRGLLLEKDDIDTAGGLLRKEEFVYYQDTTQFVKSICKHRKLAGFLIWIGYNKVYCYYPGIAHKTITEYSTDGSSPHVTTTTFEYDSFRNTSKETITCGTESEEIRSIYTGHFPNSYNYQNGLVNFLVEQVRVKNGKIIAANKTIWTGSASDYSVVPQATYRWDASQLQSAGNYPYVGSSYDFAGSRYQLINDFSLYDGQDNLTEWADAEGNICSIMWGYGGLYPIAIIQGIDNRMLTMANFGTLYQDALPEEEETRLRSMNVLVTTYTWIPHVGVRTITDPSGRKTCYEYDGFHRLTGVFDDDGKPVQCYQYNIQNDAL